MIITSATIMFALSSTRLVHAYPLQSASACLAAAVSAEGIEMVLPDSASKVVLPTLSSDPNGADIVVVGDIHSDYDHFERILHHSGMMDIQSRTWTGGTSKLVFLGDYTQGLRPNLKASWVPTADADKKILDTIARLSEQALQNGGEVIAIQGNHDLMQVLGEGRKYVAADQDLSEFQMGQKYGDQIAAMPVIRKIGKLLFVHGGLGKLQKEDLEGTPEQIMQKLQEQNIQNLQDKVKDFKSNYPLQHDTSLPTDEVLKKLGVEHVIVGHKPGDHVRQVPNSFGEYDLKLIRVDSMISRAFGEYGAQERRRGSHLLLPEGDVTKAKVRYNTYFAMRMKKKKPLLEELSSADLREAAAII